MSREGAHVVFVTGRAGAGKTTFAKRLLAIPGTIVLDSDEIRKVYPTGFSDEERELHILKMAQLAEVLRAQGFTVVIAAIMPKKEWRQRARRLVKASSLVYIEGGVMWPGTEYEEPDAEEKLNQGF